jgi:alpha,alpha-trehalose phosphorylase
MRDNDGTLSFWPRRASEEQALLRFRITWGQRLEVEIASGKVEYTLREGECLVIQVIRHETEKIQLTRQYPSAVRPVSGW